jgi:prepilin-type N-terminal cleavage/methylation domain-containing protein
MNNRRAFTYVELMIVIVVAAILTLVALSGSDAGAQQQGELAGERFAADVVYARSLCIARPDDPVIVKVDAAANRYWVARAATPDTPITHPQTKQAYMVSFGTTGNSGLDRVQIVATDLGGDAVLGFDASGSTDQQTPAILHLNSAGQNYEIAVQPAAVATSTMKEFSVQLAGDLEFQAKGSGSGSK